MGEETQPFPPFWKGVVEHSKNRQMCGLQTNYYSKLPATLSAFKPLSMGGIVQVERPLNSIWFMSCRRFGPDFWSKSGPEASPTITWQQPASRSALPLAKSKEQSQHEVASRDSSTR